MGTPIPVTLLSGFLGSGKTTTLNHILQENKNIRFALVVNDMGEINIDAHLLSNRGESTEVASLKNGCICCSLSAALDGELTKIAQKQEFDYIIIESTGIANPGEVARLIDFRDESGYSLSDVTYLDTKITLVDTHNFIEMLYDEAALDEEENLDHAYNTVSQLLISQVESADTIVLNKVDLVDEEKLDVVRRIVSECNPDAALITASFGKVPLTELINTQKHDSADSFRDKSFDAVLHKHDHAAHCTDEQCRCHENNSHHIGSFSYKARTPFHPERLRDWLESDWEGVIRAKGLFWLASRPEEIGLLQLVGSTLDVVSIGRWWADTPKKYWPTSPELLEAIEKEWDEQAGDRKQELVFIGASMDQNAIIAGFDAALLTVEEMAKGYEYWIQQGDDFPQWDYE